MMKMDTQLIHCNIITFILLLFNKETINLLLKIHKILRYLKKDLFIIIIL